MNSAEADHAHLLLDLTTRAVLSIHSNLAAIVFVSQCTRDTDFKPAYTRFRDASSRPTKSLLERLGWRAPSGGLFQMNHKLVSPARYPEWMWKQTTRNFAPLHPDLITPELRAKSALAHAKVCTIDTLMRNISFLRAKLDTGVSHQDSIYLQKKREAEAFKSAGFAPERAIDFPHITNYALHAGVSLERAARDILLQAQLADDRLLKTEVLRLTFFKKVKQAKTAEDLRTVLSEFVEATHRNALG